MSKDCINTTMSKDCGHHHGEDCHQQLHRRVAAAILGFVILVLLVIFLIWIILRPTKPRFILQDATVYAFNLSTTAAEPTPNTLTTTMQVTLSSFNPNQRIGIYYTKLDVYASYRGQQISLATELPASYQGHRDLTVWSPFLYGTSVPVSPYLLGSLQQDQTAGGVLVNVKVNGRVKWKVGTWTSGRYHVYANCPAYIRFAAAAADRDNAVGVAAAPEELKLASPGVKLQLVQSCTVDV